MSQIDGEYTITIAGRDYTLRYDWAALAEVEQSHGDDPNFFNSTVLASIAATGLKRHHPEMTAAKIMELSPPLVPFIKDVQAAMQWAYFGTEPVPKEKEKKNKSRMAAGFLRRLLRR